MKMDQAVMFTFYFSTSGHYCIDIQPNKVSKMDLPVEGQRENVVIFEKNKRICLIRRNKYKRYMESLGMHQVKTSKDQRMLE